MSSAVHSNINKSRIKLILLTQKDQVSNLSFSFQDKNEQTTSIGCSLKNNDKKKFIMEFNNKEVNETTVFLRKAIHYNTYNTNKGFSKDFKSKEDNIFSIGNKSKSQKEKDNVSNYKSKKDHSFCSFYSDEESGKDYIYNVLYIRKRKYKTPIKEASYLATNQSYINLSGKLLNIQEYSLYLRYLSIKLHLIKKEKDFKVDNSDTSGLDKLRKIYPKTQSSYSDIKCNNSTNHMLSESNEKSEFNITGTHSENECLLRFDDKSQYGIKNFNSNKSINNNAENHFIDKSVIRRKNKYNTCIRLMSINSMKNEE